MLILSRKKYESIVIGGNITVKIVDVGGNKVRIGIEAPPEIPILRAELQARLLEEFGNGDEATDLMEVAI